MNNVSRKLFFILVSATVFFTGCAKKPLRPDPSSTVLGPQSGGGMLNPQDIGTTTEFGSGLQVRADGVLDDGFTIRGLLQPVYFDFDRFDIKQGERTKLDAAAQYLRENPQHRILLEGHCDWRGTAEYNLGLGDRRANAAKQYLNTLGVDNSKIETLSKGSLEAVKNADDTQAGKDRRAELVILKQ
jgi:peptidoglycan-associated lipoprotein